MQNVYLPEIEWACIKMDKVIKLEQFDTIYITGVIAECCVLSTIFSLIDIGKKIIYCKDGIAGQSEEKEKAVIKILEDLSPLHVVFE